MARKKSRKDENLWFKPFGSKVPSRCPECNTLIKVHETVYGHKDEDGQWYVVCLPCFEKHHKDNPANSTSCFEDDAPAPHAKQQSINIFIASVASTAPWGRAAAC